MGKTRFTPLQQSVHFGQFAQGLTGLFIHSFSANQKRLLACVCSDAQTNSRTFPPKAGKLRQRPGGHPSVA